MPHTPHIVHSGGESTVRASRTHRDWTLGKTNHSTTTHHRSPPASHLETSTSSSHVLLRMHKTGAQRSESPKCRSCPRSHSSTSPTLEGSRGTIAIDTPWASCNTCCTSPEMVCICCICSSCRPKSRGSSAIGGLFGAAATTQASNDAACLCNLHSTFAPPCKAWLSLHPELVLVCA